MEVCVIIIHGFCGDTSHIEPLADKLKALGYSVYTPCLKGHTGYKKDLRGVTYTDWIKDVEDVYLKVKDKYQKIILIGFSMGGLIALQIARKYDVKSVITLNTPIYLWSVRNILRYILFDLKQFKFDFIVNHFSFVRRYTYEAVKNFRHLLIETKENLGEINCDLLLNQAYEDETVRYKSVQYLYDHVSSENKKINLYHNSNHMILQSEIAEDVVSDVCDYIENKLKKPN